MSIIIVSTEPILEQEIDCKVDNIIIEPKDISKQFNQIWNSTKDYQMISFFPKYNNFVDKYSLNTVYKYLYCNKDIKAVYSDTVLVNNKNQQTIYYPSFDFDFHQNIFINTPLFIRPNINVRFNESVYELQNFDIYKKMRNKYILMHIPKPLINIINPQESKQYKLDLELITNG